MENNRTRSERLQLLRRVENFFELPMVILGFVWLALLIVELVYDTSPALETSGIVIWIVFVLDFLIKLLIAPDKALFLKKNVLTLISLAVPAFRILRVARVIRIFRFSRGLRLVKVVGSLNRGMRALSATMKKRAFGYVILLSLIILFGGAAGMYAFERETGALKDYGDAVWWTGMILTTMGSDYWPQSGEGRVLCVILALYGFAVFGYVTATIATFFIGRDAEDSRGDTVLSANIEKLTNEMRELKQLIQKTGTTTKQT